MWTKTTEDSTSPTPLDAWHTYVPSSNNCTSFTVIRPTRYHIKPLLYWYVNLAANTHTHLTAPCPGLPGWAGNRKVKPIWILLKQETVSGSDINWAICKSAPGSRQITMPAPHHSCFFTGQMPFLPIFLPVGCNSVKALKAIWLQNK